MVNSYTQHTPASNNNEGSKVMRVAWFPKTSDLAGNPYWHCLQSELEALGIEFETTHAGYWMTRRWLLANRTSVDVLHFHFIQPQYAVAERASFRRLMKFVSYLLVARLLGYRIVWTVHDLTPTWPKEPAWVERLARYSIAWLAHDVIVHCQKARCLVRRNFRRWWRVHVFPLPNYINAHPNNMSRSAARALLGLPTDRRVIGFIGGIRPNKGLEDLIDAFELAKTDHTLLLIAGRPWQPESYVEDLQQLADANPRILLDVREIPDEEMQLYLNAADVLAFPFRHVLTSSSVILAMSFARPVIAPRLGCLPELVGKDAGYIYEPGDVGGLAMIIEQTAGDDLVTMGVFASQRVSGYTWGDLAAATAQVYMK